MTDETLPPDTSNLNAEDIQRLAEQGFATRARDKINSAIFRNVIPSIYDFTEDEQQTFWKFFPLSKGDDGALPDVDRMFSDEQLQTACQIAVAPRMQEASNRIDPYEFVKRHLFQKNQKEYERLQAEEAMWDDYVALGKLPSPKQLESNPTLHGLFVEQHEKYIQQQEERGEPLYLDGAAEAWEEAKRLYRQHLIEQSKRARGIGTVVDNGESSKAIPKPREKRGMKAGTANRVREMHRLLAKGLSQRQAKSRSHCDPTTYYRWCLEVTGEEPIEPYQ